MDRKYLYRLDSTALLLREVCDVGYVCLTCIWNSLAWQFNRIESQVVMLFER